MDNFFFSFLNILQKDLKHIWNSHSSQKFFINVVLFINPEVLNPAWTWRAQLTWAHSTCVHIHTQIRRHWFFPLLGNKMHLEDSKYIPLVCQSSYISASFLWLLYKFEVYFHWQLERNHFESKDNARNKTKINEWNKMFSRFYSGN